MKYFLVIFFSVFSLNIFCQTKDKGGYVIIQTEGTNLYNRSMAICAIRYEPILLKDSVDKFQRKLDDLNLSTKDKEYVYYMKVYADYSYDLEKEYQFHIDFYDERKTTISGEEYRKFPQD